MNFCVLQHVWKNISLILWQEQLSMLPKRNLVHEEMHSKVEYIVAHGISTTIEGKEGSDRKLAFRNGR